MIENEASKVYEESPWVADKRAAEIVRPAPVQSADKARDIGVCKVTIEDFGVAEAVQAAKLHSAMSPEQQAIMLSAGGPGAGTCWTAMHKSPTELTQNAQWRMATALRLGATPDAGPRSTCALRKGNDGDMCEESLATHPSHSFYCKYGGARARPHRAVQCTLRRLNEQAGGYADMERHVPELHDWAGVLQQLLIDVSVRCPHAERYNDSASKPGVAAVAGEAEKRKRYGMAVRALVFETYGRLGGEGTKLLRDLVATAAANSAARMLSDDGGPSWSECC